MPNIFLSSLPYTDEGEKLILSKEEEDNCKVVYRIKDSKTAVFHGLWNSEIDYSDEFVIVPFKSTYVGLTAEIYPVGTSFANVIGSSKDVSTTGESWISVLRKAYHNRNLKCCTDGFIYSSREKNDTPYLDEVVCPQKICGQWYYPKVKPFQCQGDTVGGHIIINAKEASEFIGEQVLMLPICSGHNIAELNSSKFGVGYYMRLKENMQAAVLNGYISLPDDYSENLK